MNELHESFEPLDEPLDPKIHALFQVYCEWVRDGVPIYDGFDFLEWPDLVSWMTVIHYPDCVGRRYRPENARMIFDGVRRVRLFEADLTGQTVNGLDENFLERWSSLYGLSLRRKEPIFARSHVFGIGKDYKRFEIGLFPFAEKSGAISHILSVVQRVYE